MTADHSSDLPIKTSSNSNGSRIFEGYKALGIVTNDVPFLIRYVEKLKDVRIITCTGRYFHSYNSKLQLVEASHAHKGSISTMASDHLNVYTASEDEIYIWRQGHKWLLGTLKGHSVKVNLLLPFGPTLLSVDESSLVNVWDIKDKELVSQIPFDNENFKITAICHPTTYINKVLFGSQQGRLQLWNIRQQKLIYTFNGWNSSVKCIEQSPAVDVVAIGLDSGNIYLHNLKQDETLMHFRQEWGSVTSLCFRTDDPDKCPHLVSGSPLGHIAIWDLEKNKLKSQMRDIHDGPISCVKFMEGEPLLLTNSSDNSLKVWCFDESDSTGRLLYERDGHSMPPTKIRFHGRKGYWVLSAGLDSRLKSFSVLTERLNRNLGKASYNRKLARKIGSRRDPNVMEPIVEFTTDLTREKEWDNIAACHRQTNIVTTWSFDRMKMGEHKLLHERFKNKSNVFAKCVTLSACGNFVLIGYSTGHVDRFNIQSGIYRGSYPKNGSPAHEGPVQSVVSDQLNQMAISGGLDGHLKFWRFKTGDLLGTVTFNSSISQMMLHRDNSLLAFSTDDYELEVVDVETRRVIRHFDSLGSTISDFTFSPDSKWLIASTMDCSIRVWDLALGELIDHFLVASPCISLTMSPTGEFLATAHVQDLGIYLWSNISLYTVLSLKSLSGNFEPKLLDLPQVRIDSLETDEGIAEGDELVEEEELLQDVVDEEKMDTEDGQKPSLNEELVTLSTLHASRWKHLLNLDLIKKRNKPKEPMQKPKAAPFFIPVVSALEPKLGSLNDDQDKSRNNQGKLIRHPFSFLSPFGTTLLEGRKTSDYTKAWSMLKEMGPSAIDVEIRLLDTLVSNGEEEQVLLKSFMDSVEQGIQMRRDFEFIQACLALFLKVHSDLILKCPSLRAKSESLESLVELEWERLRLTFSENLSIINYLKSVVL